MVEKCINKIMVEKNYVYMKKNPDKYIGRELCYVCKGYEKICPNYVTLNDRIKKYDK